ncbi:hypothetical protein PEBR_34816 [Penicillium brasilianum]|uniref:Uncharacterized protein n=1 Tax=Penicillium brasilianum TaxID=104259 RepID=A0A1S9RDD9_PENBI|nr:hypothetical protein PEBR_34816 [Penicillium brasilianum]
MAICFNFKTKEPYLRLPEPHTNIIITPHRPNSLNETSSALVKILNDPRVALRLQSTPYPYSTSDGEQWVKANCKDQEGILSALREDFEKLGNSVVQNNSSNVLPRKREFFDICPFTCIREVLKTDSPTGNPLEDILIGDVRLARSSFDEYPEGSEERCLAQKQNDELLAGDENVVWSLADFLASSHHGRGIMTLAVRTIIHDWAVPRMNVRQLKSWAFEDNPGSLRVFEKNNFVRGHTLKNWASVSESRGGGKKSIVLMEWVKDDSE